MTPLTTERASAGLGRAWYGLVVLMLASFVGNMTMGVIRLLAEPIRTSLGLSDSEVGLLIGLALTLTLAIATVPLGWLADRVDRRVLLVACIAIWSASTVGFALGNSFGVLFGFAMGIAIGEAVLGPITYAMIPDLFPRDRWLSANFVFFLGALVGGYAGISAAGALVGLAEAQRGALPTGLAVLDSWRLVLLATAALGLPVILALFFVRAKRTMVVRRPDAPPPALLFGYIREHARALTGVFFGFGLSYAAAGAQAGWGAVILQRLFGESPARTGAMLGLIGGLAALAGVGMAWLLVRRLRARYGENAPMLAAQIALAVGLAASLPLVFLTSAEQYYALVAVKTAFTTMAMSLSPAILQLLAPAHLRGRVIAMGGVITIGSASAMPALIGLLSDGVFAGPRGILYALAAVVLPALFAGLLLMRWGAAAVPGTIAAAQRDTA